MSEDEVDSAAAESLARDRLVDAFQPPGELGDGEVNHLIELTTSIKSDLETGGTPDKREIEEARYWINRLETRLDEVTALFGWHPMDTGATWDDLSAAERAEIEARDSPRPRPHTDSSAGGDSDE